MRNRILILAAPMLMAVGGCGGEIAAPTVAARPAPPKPPSNPLTLRALADAHAVFGAKTYKPGGFDLIAPAATPKDGTARVVVSLSRQLAFIYRGERLVGVTTISAGVPKHPTDPGHFTVLKKAVKHRSNKYANAPMPYMQRLDHWGRAIHAGVVPGYPASHGCIRVPLPVAKRLYGLTKLGDSVFIEA